LTFYDFTKIGLTIFPIHQCESLKLRYYQRICCFGHYFAQKCCWLAYLVLKI